MAEPGTPQEEQEQQRYREELMMAGGPVSRGASNKDLPTSKDQIALDKEQEQTDQPPVYNKLIHTEASGPVAGTGMANDQRIGTPGGGTLPTEEANNSTRGGINISDDTVSAGNSSAGAVSGQGLPTDRGSITDPELDATTNTIDQMDINTDNAGRRRNDIQFAP